MKKIVIYINTNFWWIFTSNSDYLFAN